MGYKTFTFLLSLMSITGTAQLNEQYLPEKVSHAEPVFFDLIRDLGARKGERELNVGMGMAKDNTQTQYSYLVEYEFAPINRLGLEIEIPLTFAYKIRTDSPSQDANGLEGIKTAMQYSFFVSEKWQTTMAIGYIFEARVSRIHRGGSHTPFFIVARKWGSQFHTLVYTGPFFEQNPLGRITTTVLVNLSMHYVLPGTRNFLGIEVNGESKKGNTTVMIRPQIKMALSPASSVGLSLGIADNHREQRLDFLLRWIYELKKIHR